MNMIQENQLVPGRRLKQNIVNFQGQVVLKEGSVLTPENIKMLKAWGIRFGESERKERDWKALLKSMKGLKEFEQAKKETQKLFQHNRKDHPAIVELMRLNLQKKLGFDNQP